VESGMITDAEINEVARRATLATLSVRDEIGF
jgi:hypothetical protein